MTTKGKRKAVAVGTLAVTGFAEIKNQLHYGAFQAELDYSGEYWRSRPYQSRAGAVRAATVQAAARGWSIRWEEAANGRL